MAGLFNDSTSWTHIVRVEQSLFFFYVTCPLMTLEMMTLHCFLSFVSLRNACSFNIPPSPYSNTSFCLLLTFLQYAIWMLNSLGHFSPQILQLSLFHSKYMYILFVPHMPSLIILSSSHISIPSSFYEVIVQHFQRYRKIDIAYKFGTILSFLRNVADFGWHLSLFQ